MVFVIPACWSQYPFSWMDSATKARNDGENRIFYKRPPDWPIFAQLTFKTFIGQMAIFSYFLLPVTCYLLPVTCYLLPYP